MKALTVTALIEQAKGLPPESLKALIEYNSRVYIEWAKGQYQKSFAKLQQARQFGFTLSFATTYPAPGMVKVTGELAHKDGHSKFSEYEARVDMSGGKTDAQGRGSVMSYGHRYTTVDLLNLIQRGADSDGSVDVPPEDTTPKPEGYRDFENSLRSAAMVGMMDLGHAWSNGTNALRTAVPNSLWVDLKAVAEARDAVL
ncbi:MAG: hypothetical protein EBT61_20395 [Verrucomicrobia bacterium]|nr:hypothetical protein [Verrucomicrobiota bacterium]